MPPPRKPKGAADAPVRVKIYGLLSVTKRGYLILLSIGLALLLGLLTVRFVLPLPTVAADATVGVALLAWSLANLHWIILAALFLEGMEAMYILRCFQREEALRRARLPESSSHK